MHISGSRSFFASVLCAVALTPLVSSMSIPTNAEMKRDTCHTGYLRISVNEAYRPSGGDYLTLSCAGCESDNGNSNSPVLGYTSDNTSATLLEYCPGGLSPGTIATTQGTTYWIGATADQKNFWNTAKLTAFTTEYRYPSYGDDYTTNLTYIFRQPAANANQNNVQLTYSSEGDMYLSENNGFSLKPANSMSPSVYFEPHS